MLKVGDYVEFTDDYDDYSVDIRPGCKGVIVTAPRGGQRAYWVQVYTPEGKVCKDNYDNGCPCIGWWVDKVHLKKCSPFLHDTSKLDSRTLSKINSINEDWNPIIYKIREMENRWKNRNNLPSPDEEENYSEDEYEDDFDFEEAW